MTYHEWNQLLLEHFFTGKKGEVVFYVDSDVLDDICQVGGGEGVQDFLGAVRGAGKSFESHVHFATSLMKAEGPAYLPHLAALVLAWTTGQEINAQNYIKRITSILGLSSEQTYPNNWSKTEELWFDLAVWCDRNGIAFRWTPINKKRLIGIPLAHAVLTPVERRFIATYLSSYNIEFDQIAGTDLAELLEQIPGLRLMTAEALAHRPLDDHGRRVIQTVRSFMKALPEKAKGDPSSKPLVSWRLSAHLDDEDIELGLRLVSNTGSLPDNLILWCEGTELSLSKQTENISQLVKPPALEIGKYPTSISNQVTIRQPQWRSEVLILTRSPFVGGFLETSELNYGTLNLILFRRNTNLETRICDWTPCRRFLSGEWTGLLCTPADYRNAPALPGFHPDLRIKVTGGFPVPGSRRSRFFSFGPPKVTTTWGNEEVTWLLDGIPVQQAQIDLHVAAAAADCKTVKLSVAFESFYDDVELHFVAGGSLDDVQVLCVPWRDRMGGLLEETCIPPMTGIYGAITQGTHVPRNLITGEELFALGSRIGEVVGPMMRPAELHQDWAPPTWWVYLETATGEREFYFAETDTNIYPDISTSVVKRLEGAEILWIDLISSEPSVTKVYSSSESLDSESLDGRTLNSSEDRVQALFLEFMDQAGRWRKTRAID
jgi:hypothetical protein